MAPCLTFIFIIFSAFYLISGAENDTDCFFDNATLTDCLPEVVEKQDAPGFCQLYRGVTCFQYIGNRTVYVKSPLSLSHMEEKVTAAFTVIATSHDVSDECHKYAIPSLCFFAFPLCDANSPVPLARQMCRDECEVLESTICRMEYSIAKRHPLLGQQKILPVCEELPPIGSKESETCMRLGIPNAVLVDRGIKVISILPNCTYQSCSNFMVQQATQKIFTDLADHRYHKKNLTKGCLS